MNGRASMGPAPEVQQPRHRVGGHREGFSENKVAEKDQSGIQQSAVVLDTCDPSVQKDESEES